MGSTGDPPVPVGDSPTGRSRRPLPQDRSFLGSRAIPVPPGESPGGTGQWPVLPKTESVTASGAVGYQMSHSETFETGPFSTIPHPLVYLVGFDRGWSDLVGSGLFLIDTCGRKHFFPIKRT